MLLSLSSVLIFIKNLGFTVIILGYDESLLHAGPTHLLFSECNFFIFPAVFLDILIFV